MSEVTTNVEYEYTDETSIYSDLTCSICSEPLRDPCCTRCDHTFCRRCITKWVLTEDSSCPICRTPVTTDTLNQASRIVRNMIDRIRVTCMNCGQTNLQRGTFDDHLKKTCPKSVVRCSSWDVECPWTGQREQLTDHLRTCGFHALRPLFHGLVKDSREPMRDIQQLEDLCNEQYFIQRLHIHNASNHLETFTEQFDEQLLSREAQIEDQEMQLLMCSASIAHCAAQIDKLDRESQKSRIDHHDMEIKQLTFKLSLMAELLIDYHNSELEDCIRKRESNSWMDLSRQQLTDRDMDIVVRYAMNDKQCRELDLRRNQIETDGIAILAEGISNNRTLETLLISSNSIADTGVYFLVQGLAFNKSILTKLELDSNGITDDGVQHLAELLKINLTLTWLSLDKNEITDRGMQLLANALVYPKGKLETLFLSGNRMIGDASVQSLVAMLKRNRSLKKFTLENCGFSKRSKTRLQQAIPFKQDFSFDV